MITRLWAPSATEVLLSGDWMGPQPAVTLVKDSSGVWTATVGPLEPNLYSYAFIVNGVRADDPVCRCSFTAAERFALGGAKALRARFETAGIPHQSYDLPGPHVMPVFRKQLIELMPKLFR